VFLILPTAGFTEMEPQQSIIADSSGIVSCSAEGTPTPQIEWRNEEEKPLNNPRFRQLHNGSLYINLVLPQDNGTYICTFTQTKGEKRVTKLRQFIDVFVISE